MATALVTGGTAGIGAAFARALAARGDDVILVARDPARLEATAAALRSEHGVDVEVLAADLADRADLSRVAARVEDPLRPVDLLVNNAGFGTGGRLLDPDWRAHERALDVMALAVYVLGGAAGRAMRTRGHGRIVNVCSLAAFITQGGYSAIKAYAKVYSEGLANELDGTGVTVTALCPGWVRTEFHERASIAVSAIPDWVWVPADRVARETLADAEAGKVISIPTKRWKVARFALEAMPRAGVRWVSRVLTSSRD